MTGPDELALLARGELEVEGRILPASNITLIGTLTLDGLRARCVYKPVSGERPLWDFPDGTLAGREVAAYLVSEALGWDLVPPTVERDGPLGRGMVQLWREPDPDQDPVDIVPEGEVPAGYLHVFDAVVNNADRKGGHVLAMPGGHRYGVDHGVCFHHEPKLRTVLWGWATLPLREDERARVAALLELLDDPAADLAKALGERLAEAETAALRRRCADLLAHGRMPLPSGGWPAIPWPAF